MPRANWDYVGNHRIPLPPQNDQKAVVSLLDRETTRIDALLSKRQRQIELLEKKRTAIITRAITKGLNPNAKMKDSGVEWLGEIPAHWKVQQAKRLFLEVDDRTTTGDEELLSVSHLTGVSRRSEKEVNMFMAETLEGYKKCRTDDLIINTMWAWMGAIGVAREAGIVSPSYNVYRFRSNKVLPSYYDLLFRTPPFVAIAKCYSKGVWTSRLRLYPEEFFSIPLPVPPYETQMAIVEKIQEETGNYQFLRSRIEQSVELLREYRSSLITAAVSGRIDVSAMKNGTGQ